MACVLGGRVVPYLRFGYSNHIIWVCTCVGGGDVGAGMGGECGYHDVLGVCTRVMVGGVVDGEGDVCGGTQYYGDILWQALFLG